MPERAFFLSNYLYYKEGYKVIIDFTKRGDLLTEDYLQAVGAWTKFMMGRMYGKDFKMVGVSDPKKYSYIEEDCEDIPQTDSEFIIRGKYRDVKAYAEAIGREKDYIIASAEYGPDHPITVKAKAELSLIHI